MEQICRMGAPRAPCPRAAAVTHRSPTQHRRPLRRALPGARLPTDRVLCRSGSEDVEFTYVDESQEEEEDLDDDESTMRLFLDSADVRAWATWAETGLFFGFTTNPTILRRDGVQCTLPSIRQLARHAFDLEVEELQLQAWGSTSAELYSCGLDLYELDQRVVVKVPATLAGLNAARRLVDDDVPVTLTGVYAAHQAATALAAGALYAAPYLGRMNDAGKDGMQEIAKMQAIVDASTTFGGHAMRLLVASIRSADELGDLAAEGCNTFTVSPKVAAQLAEDPLTAAAAAAFQADAGAMGAFRSQ